MHRLLHCAPIVRLFVSSVLILILALSVGAPVAATPHAPACGFAELKGVVTAADTGAPLPDVNVSTSTGSTYTAANGAYTLTVAAYREPGPFQVSFLPGGASADYLHYQHPEPVELISGTTSMLDVELPLGGKITGTVKTADTNAPMADVLVSVNEGQFLAPGGADYTDADGQFSIGGLATANYFVHFDTRSSNDPLPIIEYVSVYLGNTTVVSESQIVSVTAGETTSLSMMLARGAYLTGRVSRTDTDAPATGIGVSAHVKDPLFGVPTPFAGASTFDDGSYLLEGLPPGEYWLLSSPSLFVAGNPNADLLTQWYDRQSAWEDATVVEIPPLSSGATYTVNLLADPGAAIQGKVVDATTGDPVADGSIRYGGYTPSFDPYNRFAGSQLNSEVDGSFVVKGLNPGAYFFIADGAFGSEYSWEGYVPPSAFVTATVEATETVNVMLALSKPGSIAGTLSTAQGAPLPDIAVSLEFADGTPISSFGGRTTDAEGNYAFHGLSPGVYRVKYDRFDPCGCYNKEYYSVGDGNGAPTLVHVAAGKATTNIDQVLACNASPPPALEPLYLPAVLEN